MPKAHLYFCLKGQQRPLSARNSRCYGLQGITNNNKKQANIHRAQPEQSLQSNWQQATWQLATCGRTTIYDVAADRRMLFAVVDDDDDSKDATNGTTTTTTSTGQLLIWPGRGQT